MLRKCLFGMSLILIFVAAASAQTEWNGFYAGGNFGGALGRSTANTSTVFNSAGYFAASSVATLENNGRQKLSADAFTGGLKQVRTVNPEAPFSVLKRTMSRSD